MRDGPGCVFGGGFTGSSIGAGGAGAHPRTYGEHPCPRRNRGSPGGSSPHIRGTPDLWADLGKPQRLIPADTGITIVLHSRSNLDWAHPRTYGEHPCPRRNRGSPGGSSPHIRGTPDLWADLGKPQRLIPADTGITIVLHSRSNLDWAHPRAYGEN